MADRVVVRNPGAVRAFAGKLRREATELERVAASLRGACSSVRGDWDDPQQQKVEQQVTELTQALARFRESAEATSRYCEGLAARIEAIS